MQTASTKICERMARFQELLTCQRGVVPGCYVRNESGHGLLGSWMRKSGVEEFDWTAQSSELTLFLMD